MSEDMSLQFSRCYISHISYIYILGFSFGFLGMPITITTFQFYRDKKTKVST